MPNENTDLAELEDSALNLKRVFSELIPGFGINHGKIYSCVLTSQVKTASQIIKETKICKQIVYKILKELIRWELIQKNNCSPACYFLNEPMKIYEKKTKKKHTEGQKELEKIIEKLSQNQGKKYVVTIGDETQTKIVNVIDFNTKKIVKEKEQIQQLKEKLDLVEVKKPRNGYYPFTYGDNLKTL